MKTMILSLILTCCLVGKSLFSMMATGELISPAELEREMAALQQAGSGLRCWNIDAEEFKNAAPEVSGRLGGMREETDGFHFYCNRYLRSKNCAADCTLSGIAFWLRLAEERKSDKDKEQEPPYLACVTTRWAEESCFVAVEFTCEYLRSAFVGERAVPLIDIIKAWLGARVALVQGGHLKTEPLQVYVVDSLPEGRLCCEKLVTSKDNETGRHKITFQIFFARDFFLALSDPKMQGDDARVACCSQAVTAAIRQYVVDMAELQAASDRSWEGGSDAW